MKKALHSSWYDTSHARHPWFETDKTSFFQCFLKKRVIFVNNYRAMIKGSGGDSDTDAQIQQNICEIG